MIGTSGWDYKQWESTFYSGKCSFGEYSQHFNIVELNCTFYKTPSVKAVSKWKTDAPNGFKYIVKVNRYLTHSKKLNDWNTLFQEFHTITKGLGETLSGYLIQLPPQMTIKTLDRIVEMAKFNKTTFPEIDFYVEFRHSSLFCLKVYKALAGLINIVFVNQYGVTDKMDKGFSPKLQDFELVKNTKTYFRCHGTWESQPYCGDYSDEDLMLIASLKPDIVCFDNTDSYRDQIELHIPGKIVVKNTGKPLLPSAIADAKKLIF